MTIDDVAIRDTAWPTIFSNFFVSIQLNLSRVVGVFLQKQTMDQTEEEENKLAVYFQDKNGQAIPGRPFPLGRV
jgi:hypothetical protein